MSDYSEPKTRAEKKGRDKSRKGIPYSAKHVRIAAAAAAPKSKR